MSENSFQSRNSRVQRDLLEVFVGNLPSSTTEEEIEELIKDFENVHVRRFINKETKTFCFLSCATSEDVDAIVQYFTDTGVNGKHVFVKAQRDNLQEDSSDTSSTDSRPKQKYPPRNNEGFNKVVSPSKTESPFCKLNLIKKKDSSVSQNSNSGDFYEKIQTSQIERHSKLNNSLKSNHQSFLSPKSKHEEHDEFADAKISQCEDKNSIPLLGLNPSAMNKVSPQSNTMKIAQKVPNNGILSIARGRAVNLERNKFNVPSGVSHSYSLERNQDETWGNVYKPPPLGLSPYYQNHKNTSSSSQSSSRFVRTESERYKQSKSQDNEHSFNDYPSSRSSYSRSNYNYENYSKYSDVHKDSDQSSCYSSGKPSINNRNSFYESGRNSGMYSSETTRNLNRETQDSYNHRKHNVSHLSSSRSHDSGHDPAFNQYHFRDSKASRSDMIDALSYVKAFHKASTNGKFHEERNCVSPNDDFKRYSDAGYSRRPVSEQFRDAQTKRPLFHEPIYDDELVTPTNDGDEEEEEENDDYKSYEILRVSNFPVKTNEEELFALFEDFNPIDIWISREDRRYAVTEAYVVVPDEELASNAIIQLDNTQYNKRVLLVEDVKDSDVMTDYMTLRSGRK